MGRGGQPGLAGQRPGRLVVRSRTLRGILRTALRSLRDPVRGGLRRSAPAALLEGGPMTAVASQTPDSPVTVHNGSAVELKSVSKWYGNVVAINDISMSLGAGVTGLLG